MPIPSGLAAARINIDSTDHHADDVPAARHSLSIFAILTLVAFCGYTAFDIDAANELTTVSRDFVTGNFAWLLIGVAGLILIGLILLIFHPYASLKLGYDNEKPEFPRLAWFAMLFSAGLGPGLIYWGTAEPVIHAAGNPLQHLPYMSQDPAVTGVVLAIFHWGFHGWGMYVLAGLAIAIGAYRHEQRLTFSTALIPLFGQKRIDGGLGWLIDLIALYGTVLGVATSIGLTVAVMNATVEPVTGLTFDISNQIAMLVIVCGLGIFSVLSGVARGIRRISEINIWISLVLLGIFFLLGPSVSLFVSFFENLLSYLVAVVPMGFWLASDESDQTWQSGWTVFYWGWWFAWTPFVALFIARISRGRTIREFLIGVLLVPTIVTVIWMTVFGGTAIDQEAATGGAISAAIAIDYSLATVTTIANLVPENLAIPLYLIVFFLLFTWMITSLDSATLVICHLLNFDHSVTMKVIWGTLLGSIACALMLIGGIQALQAASIIIGLPMAVVLVLVFVSMLKLIITNTRDTKLS